MLYLKYMVKLVKFHIGLQVADGILTYLGMLRFGVEFEANPIIGYLMELLGVTPALILCKGAAIVLMRHLIRNKDTLDGRDMRLALWFVNILYMLVAIIPWVIVHFHPGLIGFANMLSIGEFYEF